MNSANKSVSVFRRASLVFLFAAALITSAFMSTNGSFAQAIDPRNGPRPVADLAEELLDAVVNISTSQNVPTSRRVPAPNVPDGTPFKDFFEDFFDRRNQGGPSRRENSLGSGFVIDPNGTIVTNNHVIADADEIRAIFPDGTELVAELIGRDPKTDLAVLKVKSDQPLKHVEFGDSNGLRVGDWVMAIGNPFGLGSSLTVGVVSARNRNINSGPYDDFIQTDAAINRGNSGGPLFDMEGKVVGINTAIFSPSGVSVGIGFAVPSQLAQGVVSQLIKFGETRRGWLGVRIQDVTEDLTETLGLEKPGGALIAGVTKDGPADKAGIETGDVIIEFDSRAINKMHDLPRIVAETDPDKEVQVKIVRSGETIEIPVLVEQLQEEGQKVASADTEINSILGLELSSITAELRQKYSLKDDVKGVVVTSVEADSAAADKGIVEGSVIVEVAQNEVNEPADVVSTVKNLENRGRPSVLLLLSNSTGELRFIAIKLKDEESE